jgi:hypothetical protein
MDVSSVLDWKFDASLRTATLKFCRELGLQRHRVTPA